MISASSCGVAMGEARNVATAQASHHAAVRSPASARRRAADSNAAASVASSTAPISARAAPTKPATSPVDADPSRSAASTHSRRRFTESADTGAGYHDAAPY
jgi:hypothetical protein